ncbi:MAG: DUF2892 domain-containing protein [Pseudobdellovibrio sp.]
MKKNIHPVERAMRVTIGIVLTSFAFWGPSNLWFLLGIIPIITGLVGWCPPYSLLGVNTCNIAKK